MRRWLRIYRIWRKGKLPYAKRVREYIRTRLIMELQLLTPTFYKKFSERYGTESYINWLSKTTDCGEHCEFEEEEENDPDDVALFSVSDIISMYKNGLIPIYKLREIAKQKLNK